jgi:hypothetical protein
MKRNLILAGAITLILGSAPVWADNFDQLLGSPVTTSSADRIVEIGPDTHDINVAHFDTIKFVAGAQSFSWNFDGANTISEIDLNKIAPPGMLDHTVRVFIETSAKDLETEH